VLYEFVMDFHILTKTGRLLAFPTEVGSSGGNRTIVAVSSSASLSRRCIGVELGGAALLGIA
jgi:hypothetical protein